MPNPVPITDEQFEEFLAQRKVVEEDIEWSWDTNHEGTAKFEAILRWNDRQFRLLGSFNQVRGALSFLVVAVNRGLGQRIYALDHGGAGHRNPGGATVGSLHKHRWSTKHLDKYAYEPTDILRPPTDLAGVWQEFCTEALIEHLGKFKLPPLRQRALS